MVAHKKLYILRTRFKGGIISEFLPSFEKSNRVIIVCDGMPTVPSKRAILEFFSKKGYWVFHPRYRGSWESGGKFLRFSPHKDILGVVDGLSRGFKELWSGKVYKIIPSEINLFGSSFGGPAMLLASKDPRITKVIAFSPVVNWTSSRGESLSLMWHFIRTAFGGAYRMHKRDWKKLESGEFYNPIRHVKGIEGRKIFIIQAKDDKTVDWRSVRQFSSLTNSILMLVNKGGHFGISTFLENRFHKKILSFLNKKP